jgi:hypothetical protein
LYQASKLIVDWRGFRPDTVPHPADDIIEALQGCNGFLELAGFHRSIALFADGKLLVIGFVCIEQLDSGTFTQGAAAATRTGIFFFEGSASMCFGHI